MKTDTTYSAEAAERIISGEDPEGLVHRTSAGLSSSITLDDYQCGGYVETYRTLAEVAGGCWDNWCGA